MTLKTAFQSQNRGFSVSYEVVWQMASKWPANDQQIKSYAQEGIYLINLFELDSSSGFITCSFTASLISLDMLAE